MTKNELSYLFKYLLIMIIPTIGIFYLSELGFGYLVEGYAASGVEETILKSITIVWIFAAVRLWNKKDTQFYSNISRYTNVTLTGYLLKFLIYSFLIYFGVKIIFNQINRSPAFQFDSLIDIAINEILLITVLLVNLNKNNKLLKERTIERTDTTQE